MKTTKEIGAELIELQDTISGLVAKFNSNNPEVVICSLQANETTHSTKCGALLSTKVEVQIKANMNHGK
jgi:hypothetical protein